MAKNSDHSGDQVAPSQQSRNGDTASRSDRLVRWITPGAGLFAVLVACVVLVGWPLGGEAVLRVLKVPGAGIMQPNTAMGFLLTGGALLLLQRREVSSGRRRSGRVLAAAAGLLGLLTFAE
jgi:hypothetical protein